MRMKMETSLEGGGGLMVKGCLRTERTWKPILRRALSTSSGE